MLPSKKLRCNIIILYKNYKLLEFFIKQDLIRIYSQTQQIAPKIFLESCPPNPPTICYILSLLFFLNSNSY